MTRRPARPAAGLAGVVAVLLLGAMAAQAYKPLDTIPVRVRVQMNGKRTDAVEVGFGPRFNHGGIASVNLRHSLPVLHEESTDGVVKIQLLLDHDRFMTPWLTLHDGKTHLRMLAFECETRGQDLTSVVFTPFYQDVSTEGEDAFVVHFQSSFFTHHTATPDVALWVVFGLAFLVNTGLLLNGAMTAGNSLLLAQAQKGN